MADPIGGHESIRVVGLQDLQRALRALGPDFARSLKDANKRAAEIVAEDARRRAMSQGGVAAKTGTSVKATAEQRRSKVAIGGARYPFAMGAEFGSTAYKQFEPWRRNGSDAGYFLFPAVRGTRDEFMDAYMAALVQVTRAAFPK